MKVAVYWNLHKHLFSVRALEGPDKGRVIAHEKQLYLRDVELKVSQAGRERVLRQRCRNVHAWASGWICDGFDRPHAQPEVITYNPYKAATFVSLNRQFAPVQKIALAWFSDRYIYGWGVE